MPSRDVRPSSAAALATAARSAPRRPSRSLPPAHRPTTLETLEPRVMMDASYLYNGQESFLKLPTDRLGGVGANTNITILDDLDGDGTKEIAASGTIPITHENGSVSFDGVVRVLSGRDGHVLRELRTPNLNNSLFGSVLALCDDLDSDGARDLVVSDFAATTNDVLGTVRVFSARSGLQITAFAVGNKEFSRGTFATVGDLNGDGKTDLVVSDVFPNQIGGKTVLLRAFSIQSGTMLWESAPAAGTAYGTAQHFLSTVLDVGDQTGDGKPDVLVGDDDLADALGAVFLVSGANGALVRAWPLGTPTNVAGNRLAYLGDVNADGHGDFAVVSYERTTGSTVPLAKISVFSLNTSSLATPIWVKENIPWTNESGETQIAFKAIDDFNHDGVADLAVMADPSSPQSTLQIRSGRNGALIQEITGTSVISDRGRTTGNVFFGSSVASGDLDGDGFNELLVGVQQAESPREGKSATNPFVAVIPLMKFETPVVARVNAAGVAFGTIAGRDFVTVDGLVTPVSAIKGLLVNDFIIDRNNLDVAIGGGTADGPAFILDHGTRIELSTLATVDQLSTNPGFISKPAGVYTMPTALKLASHARAALVKVLRDGTIATTWLLRRNSADTAYELVYVTDGEPGAISPDGKAFAVNRVNDGVGGTVSWVVRFVPEPASSWAITTNAGINVTSLVSSSAFAGIWTAGDNIGRPLVAYETGTGQQGRLVTVTLPTVNGIDLAVIAVDRALDILASYTADSVSHAVLLVRVPSGTAEADTWTVTDLGAQDWLRAPDFHDKSENLIPLALAPSGRIFAVHDGSAFMLGQRAALGPAQLDPSQVLATAPIGDSGTVIVGLNDFGELLYFRRESDSTPWTVEELPLGSIASNPRIYGAVAWDDQAAIATDQGVVQLARLSGGGWEVLNIATLLPESTPKITSNFKLLRNNRGIPYLVGVTDANEIVYLVNFGAQTGTSRDWAFVNITSEVRDGFGLPDPNLQGELITYVTPWDGLNIARVNGQGEPVVYWTAPGLIGWRLSNLASAVADPSLARGFERIVANVLPWGGIGITSADAQLRTVWWAPGLGGTWQFASLVDAVTDGPRPTLVKDSVVAYSTTWGGQNITGIDANGRLWVYWWSPQSNRWAADSLQSAVPAFEGRTFTSRTSAYSVNVPAQTPMAVTAIDTFGHAVHLSFNVTTGWQGADATDEWEMGA